MNCHWIALMVVTTAVVSGCASITGSEIQTLTLTVNDAKGAAVTDAKCKLENDKGNWQSNSPSHIDVRRSANDLIVECKKEGLVDGFLRAISRVSGGMIGNIVFGGAIGALIDHTKGTGYNYPDNLYVIMGEANIVDRSIQTAATDAATKDQGNAHTTVASAGKLPAATEASANEKLLTHAELRTLLGRERKFQVTGMGGLSSLSFQSNGDLEAQFNVNMRTGTYTIQRPSAKVCMSFSGSGLGQRMLSDCFSVSFITNKKYRFTASDKTEFIALF